MPNPAPRDHEDRDGRDGRDDHPAADDPRFVADGEVRANGGEIVHRGPLRVDDPHWPAEAGRLGRGLRIRDATNPDARSWVALVFPDGSVRLEPRLAQACWFTLAAPPGQGA